MAGCGLSNGRRDIDAEKDKKYHIIYKRNIMKPNTGHLMSNDNQWVSAKLRTNDTAFMMLVKFDPPLVVTSWESG